MLTPVVAVPVVVGRSQAAQTRPGDAQTIQQGLEAAARIHAREQAGNYGYTREHDEAAIREGQRAAARVHAREQAAYAKQGPKMQSSGHLCFNDVQKQASAIAATSLLLASPFGPALLMQDWAIKQGLIR